MREQDEATSVSAGVLECTAGREKGNRWCSKVYCRKVGMAAGVGSKGRLQ